jgi:hypothetical protein
MLLLSRLSAIFREILAVIFHSVLYWIFIYIVGFSLGFLFRWKKYGRYRLYIDMRGKKETSYINYFGHFDHLINLYTIYNFILRY